MMYTNKDVNLMSWQEFATLIEVLLNKIAESGEKISVISPMLRTGGIVGGVLSIKMGVIPMLPVQFKYSYNPTRVNQLLLVPELSVVPEKMNILLCEGNTGSGATATKAAAVIKEKYPEAKVYLATLTKIYGGSDSLEGIERIFYGVLTNEYFKVSAIESEKLGLRNGITIFPWENVNDELSDINNS